MQLHKEEINDEQLIQTIGAVLLDKSQSQKVLIGGSFAYYYVRHGLDYALQTSGDIDVYSQFSNTPPYLITEFSRPRPARIRRSRTDLVAQMICCNPAYKHLHVFDNYFTPEKNLQDFDAVDRAHCAETMQQYAALQDVSNKGYRLDQLRLDYLVEKLLYLYDIANYNNMLLFEYSYNQSIKATKYTLGSPDYTQLAFNDRQIAWFEYLKYRNDDPSEDPNDIVLYIHLAIVSKRILLKAKSENLPISPTSRCYIESFLNMRPDASATDRKTVEIFENSSLRGKRKTIDSLQYEINQLLNG